MCIRDRYQWVPYSRISDNLKRALIAAEDASFVDHEGFDWEGIQKAYEKNLRKGKIVAGGSTISQQLAKNLFLSTKRTPWRKIEEAAITLMLEAVMDKQRIFEIYLNVIEWGNGVFGAEAAARHYYRTSASQLSAAQAAKLAAMVPNPRYYDSHRDARGLQRKTGIILGAMTDTENHHTENVQQHLKQVESLLHKHALLEELTHKQEIPRQDRHALVDTLVHKQHLAELRRRLELSLIHI